MPQSKLSQDDSHNYTTTGTKIKFRTQNAGNPLTHDAVDTNFELLRGAVNGLVDDVALKLEASDLSPYVTSTSLTTTLGDYVTANSLSTTIGSYVTTSSLTTTLGSYATTSALTTGLSGKQPTGNYLTSHQSLSNYATTSALTTGLAGKQNTGNYLTSHQSLASYSTTTQMNQAITNAIPDVSSFITASDIPAAADLSVYATTQFVNSALGNYALSSAIPDLTDYAKLTDIPSVTGFITAIPSEYVTDTELTTALGSYATTTALSTGLSGKQDAGTYLTSHQSLSNYYTKTQTDSAISSGGADLSGYYTSSQTDTAISTATGGLTIPTSINDLSDVQTLGTGHVPTDGQALVWKQSHNGGLGHWMPITISSSGSSGGSGVGGGAYIDIITTANNNNDLKHTYADFDATTQAVLVVVANVGLVQRAISLASQLGYTAYNVAADGVWDKYSRVGMESNPGYWEVPVCAPANRNSINDIFAAGVLQISQNYWLWIESDGKVYTYISAFGNSAPTEYVASGTSKSPDVLQLLRLGRQGTGDGGVTVPTFAYDATLKTLTITT